MKFNQTRLGDFAAQVKRVVIIDDDSKYKTLGCRLYGKGVYQRETKRGSEIKAKRMFLVSEGDLVINRIWAHKGSAGIVPKEISGSVVTNDFPVFELDKERIDPQYISWFLRTDDFQRECFKHSYGTSGRRRLKPSEALNLTFPNCDLELQKKIVEKLELVIKQKQKIEMNTSSTTNLIKNLRVAILSKAFRGELTERAPDDEPAEILLERIQRERAATTKKSLPRRAASKRSSQNGFLEPHNLPNGWLWTTVGNLILESRYGTSAKCSAETKGIPVLRIPNVVRGLDFRELKYAKPQEINLDKLRVQNGDILVVRTNGSLSLVGRSSVVREMRKDYAFASYLIRLRLPASDSLSEYVALAMESDFGRRAIENRARTTAGQYNVNTEMILSIPVPLPTSREIDAIVRTCRTAFSLCSLLEMNAEAAMKQIGSLEAKILNQVFQGRLFLGSLTRKSTVE